jgi:diguanylate cyclase (GGDEF)-like protein
MSDFSEAFNAIVQKLKEFQEAEGQRANHLHNQKQSAIKSLLDAKTSRAESEKLSAQVNSLLDEIRGLQLLLREQAIRDQLTGLFNRRYLGETLERELARAQRGNYPVSVIMIDLDNFKKLNDIYGNRVGDLILESLGKMLLQKTRLGDIPCRYGGEEMVVVFPNMDVEMTAQRAEFLRKAFERSSINNAGLTIRTTFSAA